MLLVHSSNRCFLKCECEEQKCKVDGKQNEASKNRLTNFEVSAGRSALRAPNHTERHSVSAEGWQKEAVAQR